jgi:hypothetical protein
MNNMLYCNLLSLMSVSPCDDSHFNTFSVKLHHHAVGPLTVCSYILKGLHSDVLQFVLLILELCPLCSFPVRTLHADCVFLGCEAMLTFYGCLWADEPSLTS